MKEYIITLQRMVGDMTDTTGYDDATAAAERTALEAAIALMQAVKEQKDNDRSFWHRIIDEKLTPPWPLPHHAEAMGLSAQQPADCPKCGGTGEADSGGTMPWGAPAMISCDCQQPAAVDEAMVDRAWAAYDSNVGTVREDIRAALVAALATQQGGES